MKIQQLIIHNIASIEDAEIDFSAKPLADSDVFLITGKTGSGKSTLLDAICLALYNTTPRLDGTRMEGKFPDAGAEHSLSDPAQLLRENTGEGFVRLRFEGSDGVPYEAEWSIARARNKPTGRLQPKRWVLKDLRTGVQYGKAQDIRAVIADAVRLNFEQFCRTTLLAQGEFTRFLNSKDEEKAEILEMITGADSYAKIGAKIYEITQQQRVAYEKAQSAVEGVHLLSEAERKERQDKIAENLRLSGEAEAVRDDALRKKVYLETLGTLQQHLSEAEKALAEALSQYDTEQARSERQWLDSYRQSGTARTQLAQALAERKTAARAQAQIQALARDYQTVLGGAFFLKARKDALVSEQEDVRVALEQELPLSSVLDQAQALGTYTRSILEGQGVIADLDAEIALKEQEIARTLEPQRSAASAVHAEKVAARALASQVLAEADERLRQARLGAIRDETRTLMQERGAIGVALERIKNLEEAERLRREEKAAIDAQEKQLTGKTVARDALRTAVASQKASLDAAKGLFEEARRAGGTLVAGLRRKLSVGDVCPVCFQKIAQELPTDEAVEARLRPLEEAYERARKSFDAQYAELLQAEADLTAEMSAWTARKTRFAREDPLQSRRSESLSALRACGVTTLAADTKEVLFQRLGAIQVRLGELSALETVGQKLEKALDAARSDDRAAEQAVVMAKDVLDAATDALHVAAGNVHTWKVLRSSRAESVQRAVASVQGILRGSAWAGTWQEDIAAFQAFLREALGRSQSLRRRQADLAVSVHALEEELRRVDTAVAGILTLKPDWKGMTGSEAVEVAALSDQALSLKDRLIAEHRTYTESIQKALAAERQVEAYLAEHPGLNQDRLMALLAYSAEDIQRLEASQKVLSDALISAKTTRENAWKDLSAHLARKPELSEADTLASLSEAASSASRRALDIAAVTGALRKELSDDQQRQQQLGALVREAEARLSVYTRWYRLNELIGDQTGKKFRKIAQSYVLGTLVHAANHYMQELTDRYTLKVEPGTFIISLEDAYQGYVTRPASTISGGESFLVSLSLALALSDIGDVLSVDTLFIDEGFGSLSGEPLQHAIHTLKMLRTRAGRHVGIISHIEELQDKIAVKIQLEQNPRTGSSTVQVSG